MERPNDYCEVTFGKFRIYLSKKMLINSENLNKIKNSTYFCYEFALKAKKDGKLAEYWPKAYVKSMKDFNVDILFPQWAKIARDALKAKKPLSNSSIDVLFPPIVVREAFIQTLGPASTAKSVYEKSTPFALNKTVASPNFTVYDDGLLPDGLNTSPFDGEGFPKQNTKIIDKGDCVNFLYDQKYAQLMKTASTGNGSRYGGSIDVEMHNLVIEPGTDSLKDMIADCKNGLYIDAFSWLNPSMISGIFGSEIRNAYQIENGEITNPIRGGSLSGNIYEMLHNISGISKEIHNIMNAKVPFMRFKNLNLSSE
jgi:PmbA protein